MDIEKQIVLIEDDEDIASAIALILESNGYKVSSFQAFTTKEELSALNADLFIIDERLPVVSGHIICILLRSTPAKKRVPQLLMSASHVLDKFAGLAEVNASLQKPFEMDDLLKIVRELIPYQIS